jgi:capsular polysaccharide biosynthesis protein
MPQDVLEDELSFADIWLTIKRYKQIVLFTPLACAVVATIFVSYFIPPQWEASAIFQVGQVGPLAKPAEPIANTVARMLAPSFAAEILSETNKFENLVAAKAINDRSFMVHKLKDADLLELKVRGSSSEIARTLVLNAVSYLKKSHDELMASSVDAIKAQIKFVNEEFEQVKSERDFLKNHLLGRHDWGSYEATLAATILQDKSKELRELDSTKLLLAEQLSPSTTFSTRLVGDVSVVPVTIKKAYIIALAILVGLIGGIFIAFVRSALNPQK